MAPPVRDDAIPVLYALVTALDSIGTEPTDENMDTVYEAAREGAEFLVCHAGDEGCPFEHAPTHADACDLIDFLVVHIAALWPRKSRLPGEEAYPDTAYERLGKVAAAAREWLEEVTELYTAPGWAG